jgi:hypothetical protein
MTNNGYYIEMELVTSAQQNLMAFVKISPGI